MLNSPGHRLAMAIRRLAMPDPAGLPPPATGPAQLTQAGAHEDAATAQDEPDGAGAEPYIPGAW
eukprot:4317800-Alexandrium_andersonii.AAC.1